jgi:hypothetical protein
VNRVPAHRDTRGGYMIQLDHARLNSRMIVVLESGYSRGDDLGLRLLMTVLSS